MEASTVDELDAAFDGALNMHDEWYHHGHAEGFADGGGVGMGVLLRFSWGEGMGAAAKASVEGRELGEKQAKGVAAEAGFMRGACLGVASRLDAVPGKRGPCTVGVAIVDCVVAIQRRSERGCRHRWSRLSKVCLMVFCLMVGAHRLMLLLAQRMLPLSGTTLQRKPSLTRLSC